MNKIDFSDRHTYIGASDAAEALGLSKWSDPPYTRIGLWKRMTLRAPAQEHKAVFDRGNEMEAVAIRKFEEKYCCEVFSKQEEYFTDDRRVRCHLDGAVSLNHEEFGGQCNAVLEVKCPGESRTRYLIQHGPDESHIIQMQIQMWLTDLKKAIFVIFDYEDWDIVCIPIDRDDEMIAKIKDGLYEFLDYVDRDECPPDGPLPIEIPMPNMGTLEVYDGDERCDLLQALAAAKVGRDEAARVYNELAEMGKERFKDFVKVESADCVVTYSAPTKKRTIDGKSLLRWSIELCESVRDGDSEKSLIMAKNLLEDREMFTKLGEASRRFQVKPLEGQDE